MNGRRWAAGGVLFGFLLAPLVASPLQGPQDKEARRDPQDKGRGEPPRDQFIPFGPGGPPFGGGRGPGGPMGGQERKLVKQFDKDGNGWLNKDERAAAREFLKNDGGGGGRRGFGGPRGGGFGGRGETPKPGSRVSPADVKSYSDSNLYEPTALRTLFLEFENSDWETELQEFRGTDVEVPATLTVDGKRYPNVGIHFRGASSYFGVGTGSKRSLNISMDLADKKQRLSGSKTLNLLNAHEDGSFLGSVLYSHVARQYIPAPKVNVVKVVINGESWGVYANAQQFDTAFIKENFKTDKGTRWKVRGSPGGGGGLEYLGENVEDYKRRYQIKSADNAKAWKALINLCKVLNQTPADRLEEALAPIVDVDGLLWFLALDMALINNDGYWIRASDYSIYLDPKGKFHFIPHDMNEAFRPAGGPGFGGPGGPGGGMMMIAARPGDAMPPFLQDMLGLTEAQRKTVTEIQKDVDSQLEKILNNEQRNQLRAMRTGPQGGIAGPGGPPVFGPPGGPGGGPGPGGPGRGGPGGAGPRGGGVELDPLYGLEDARKPLRSKVLAVPALRTRYLQNVRTIAEKSLDWKVLGPVVAQYRALIEKEVEADTKKLDSFADFQRVTSDTVSPDAARGRGMSAMNFRAFADQRRKYLLSYQEPKKPS